MLRSGVDAGHGGMLAAVSQITDSMTRWVREALVELGTERLAFLAFDAALPRPDALDVGVGTAHGVAGRELIDFISRLGFNALQLGPRGAVSASNHSPYDGTTFSRDPLLVDLAELARPESAGGPALLSERDLEDALSGRPGGVERRACHRFAIAAQSRLLSLAWHRQCEREAAGAERAAEVSGAVARFRTRHADWLLADALYEPLCEHHGAGDFARWSESSPAPGVGDDVALWRARYPPEPCPPDRPRELGLLGFSLVERSLRRLRRLAVEHESRVAFYGFVQYLLSHQHTALREQARRAGVALFGDLAVGCSRRDQWHFASAFLPGYLLGAPPSRTNPSGQPWGYPVLDPDQLGPSHLSGVAGRLLEARAARAFDEYDAVRIDHPHGLVCPWVYAQGTSDPLTAVQSGARLFSSPGLPDHPSLARFSRVSEDQIDSRRPRHDDHWVTSLTSQQVEAFSTSLDRLVRAAGGDSSRLICEVLSTQPRELGCVRARHGLGRFRVTQKANLADPDDVYRSENARPEDWVMLGNHDTPTLWACIERWQRDGSLRDRADYLAGRLASSPDDRKQMAARFRDSAVDLAHAMLADLFACDARNAAVAFTDLFGFIEPYNTPGLVSDQNWSLRLPRDHRGQYERDVRSGRALWLPCALALALRKKRPDSALLAAADRFRHGSAP